MRLSVLRRVITPKMNGPKYIRFFSSVIEALKELGGSGRPSEVGDVIARRLNISEQERTQLLKGGASRFDNQVAWARFYLVKIGLVDSSKRGVWSLRVRAFVSTAIERIRDCASHSYRTFGGRWH